MRRPDRRWSGSEGQGLASLRELDKEALDDRCAARGQLPGRMGFEHARPNGRGHALQATHGEVRPRHAYLPWASFIVSGWRRRGSWTCSAAASPLSRPQCLRATTPLIPSAEDASPNLPGRMARIGVATAGRTRRAPKATPRCSHPNLPMSSNDEGARAPGGSSRPGSGRGRACPGKRQGTVLSALGGDQAGAVAVGPVARRASRG